MNHRNGMEESMHKREWDSFLLSFPLKTKVRTKTLDSTDWEQEYVQGGIHHVKRSESRSSQQKTEIASLQLGGLQLLALRTTPCVTTDEGRGFSTLAMMRGGDKCRYKEGMLAQEMTPGDILLKPRNGELVKVGHFSGFLCDIEHKRLSRTIHSMQGGSSEWNAGRSCLMRGVGSNGDCANKGYLWLLFSFIDKLLGESTYLAAGLGLDEQIYRMLAMALFQEEGTLEAIQNRWVTCTKKWTNQLDDLVDLIRQNAHLNLTLTDLEEQSHYSSRHLQSMFKEKFDCTPMQFVRRQRLSAAMEKLQTADYGETVTSISRDFGYRYTSNFCTDFQREFGVTPSVVIRSSQRGGGQITCDNLEILAKDWIA